MLFPVGTDQPRSRIPKVTLTIIIICFAVYPFSYLLREIMSVGPDFSEIHKYKILEKDLMVKWLRNKGEEKPVRAYMVLNQNPEKLQEAIRSFQSDMEGKHLEPKTEKKYRKWKELREDILSYRKKNFDYRVGYVASDFRVHTLLTHIFIHGGFLHVFFNMYFLWIVGIGLEEVWGRKIYLAFFLAGGVAAALGHHLFTAHPDIPTIGASGAVSALMGAYMIRFYKARLRFLFFKWEFWLRSWIVIAFWLGGDVYDAVTGIGEARHIAVFAHLGGYTLGIIGAFGIMWSGVEERFISKDLEKQDEKDSIKAAKKQEKKEIKQQERLPEFEQGLDARKLGHLEEAADLIREAIVQRPGDIEMREELLRIEQMRGNHDGMSQQIGAIIGIYFKKNDTESVFRWYRYFLEVVPGSRVAGNWNYRIATELYKQGHFAHAVAEFYRFAAGKPDDNMAPKALFSGALIQGDKMGEREKAIQALDRLAEKYPQWMPEEVSNTRQRLSKPPQGS